jgi:hypothetical protein
MFEFRVNWHSPLQQEIHGAGAAELTSPREAVFQLRLGSICCETAILLEESPDHVEPSRAGRSLEVKPRAVLGHKLGAFRAPISQAVIHNRADPETVHGRAVIKQKRN